MVSRTRMIPNRSVAYWQIRRERAVRDGEQSASLFAIFVVPNQMRHRVRRGTFAHRKFTTAVRDGRLRCGEQESLTTSPVDDDEPVDRQTSLVLGCPCHSECQYRRRAELKVKLSRSAFPVRNASLDSALASQIDC
jgi:hypothetical protein